MTDPEKKEPRPRRSRRKAEEAPQEQGSQPDPLTQLPELDEIVRDIISAEKEEITVVMGDSVHSVFDFPDDPILDELKEDLVRKFRQDSGE